jgi:alpha-glucoside transport system permease protein
MKGKKRGGLLLVNGALALLVIIWSIPTLGLLISSFRQRSDIATTGWWMIFPHREWETVATLDPKALGLDPNAVMTVEGVTGTFDQLRNGIESPDGKTRVAWVGNKRLGTIEVQSRQWVWPWDWEYTLDNYKQVLLGTGLQAKNPDGTVETLPGQDMSQAFLNSLAVSIPSTVIPILIAAFAAYAFAWMNFPGRRLMFILVVGLLVVPLQIALVPILRDYMTLNLNGTFLAVWLAHTGFGLALATYLLFNYIRTMPRETLESAFIDGASHFTIFVKLILPLSVPALASFAIFQFLWVWNDYLVALTFLGVDPSYKVLTQRLADLTGTFGNQWQLLTAGAFVTMILPMVVFFALQRYFVRGLMAGSVKG